MQYVYITNILKTFPHNLRKEPFLSQVYNLLTTVFSMFLYSSCKLMLHYTTYIIINIKNFN